MSKKIEKNVVTMLTAINFNIKKAAEDNKKTGAAVALFTRNKSGSMVVNESKKTMERDCLRGITAEQYKKYAGNVLSVYYDALHMATYAADAEKTKTIKSLYFADLAELVKSIMGDTFKVNDVFTTFTVEDFMMQSVSKVRDFSAGTDGANVIPETLSKFVKWLESWFSANASGVAMLPIAERDRLNSIRRLTSKINRLTTTIKNATNNIKTAEEELSALKTAKADAMAIAKKEKAITGMKNDLAEVKKSLQIATESMADLKSKDFSKDYSDAEKV